MSPSPFTEGDKSLANFIPEPCSCKCSETSCTLQGRMPVPRSMGSVSSLIRTAAPFLTFVLGAFLGPAIKSFYEWTTNAEVTVTASHETIKRFGVVQALREGKIVNEAHFRDGGSGFSAPAIAEMTLAPGFYEIRLATAGRYFSITRQEFSRLSRIRLSDSKITFPPLFGDQEFVRIPAGSFLMGSEDFINSQPRHELYISEFYMRSFPITVCEYGLFLRETTGETRGSMDECNPEIANLPVTNMTYHTAIDFCKWFSSWNHRAYRASGYMPHSFNCLEIAPEFS